MARKVARAFGAQLFVPTKYRTGQDEYGFSNFKEVLAARLHVFSQHIFIAATGIVVRCIAPLLKGKTQDPAVVVLDQDGRFAISLVGGHAAGANTLARQVAEETNGQPVITTATDVAGLPAIDVLAKDLRLVPDPREGLKIIASKLLAGDRIQIWDPDLRLLPTLQALGHANLFCQVPQGDDWQSDRPGLWVSWRNETSLRDRIVLHPRCLVAGLGLHRGIAGHALVSFIKNIFQDNGLALASLGIVATITSRANEPGLQEMANSLGVKVVFFTTKQLAGVFPPNPSPTLARLIGTHSVCEAAAMLASGNQSLLVPKTKASTMTLAVALAV
ncbi:MAG TPA: cobalamin biosynthesis protein CbiG [Desulfonatronum sp.]|nr:cobalamin biosynthesis protein CbiG [Desulfonatronum sp.]